MSKNFILLLSFLLGTGHTSGAQTTTYLSPHRDSSESFQQVLHLRQMEKSLTELSTLPVDRLDSLEGLPRPNPQATAAVELRVAATVFNQNLVPRLPSQAPWVELEDSISAEEVFRKIRDRRLIPSPEDNSKRRPTWLYPDDGCYARAEIAAQELIELGYPRPNKIFAFGNLKVQTPNSLSGEVTWWYHVVAAYKHRGKILVFDPALEPLHSLTLQQWLKKMGNSSENEVEVSVCSATAVDPESNCKDSGGMTKSRAISLQLPFLPLEWDRLLELGRRPELELGDLPPWSLLAN